MTRHFRKVVVVLIVACAVADKAMAAFIVEPAGATVAGKTVAAWTTNWWQWAAALAPPGALSLGCRRGGADRLDRIGGRPELVRGDVCDHCRLAGSVGRMACRPCQIPGRSHGMATRRAGL